MDVSAQAQLAAVRLARGFCAERVLAAKVQRILGFFRQNALDCAVVGLSGGVDSALVLALLQAAMRAEGSALKRVVALSVPIESAGATTQQESNRLAKSVADSLESELWVSPQGPAMEALMRSLTDASGISPTPWAQGQALSVLRTPVLYGAAAMLQSQGFRSVVVGTTNRDEGALLGFFGKASDAMVDVQPIADLHKSEVRALARLCKIPDEVISRAPRGDVFDGRDDHAMIGASYDEVELFLSLLAYGFEQEAHALSAAKSLIALCAHNAHKYRVASPAVFLDVMPRGVPGGWTDTPFAPRTERKPAPGVLVGAFTLDTLALDPVGSLATLTEVSRLRPELGSITQCDNVLSARDSELLRDAMDSAPEQASVGVTGVQRSYGQGSVRSTAFAPALAAQLWERTRALAPAVRFCDAFSATDAFATERRTGHMAWRVVGLSPILRFMRYAPGGQHFAHYDAGFDYRDGRRSLLSIVFYLTDGPSSGALRFISESQSSMPTSARSFDDWTRPSRDDEVLASVHPKVGRVVLFDHRLCHDVAPWEGPGDRVIIRGDVVYEAIPDQPVERLA